MLSGIARVPCTRGQNLFLRHHQLKKHSLKRKILLFVNFVIFKNAPLIPKNDVTKLKARLL